MKKSIREDVIGRQREEEYERRVKGMKYRRNYVNGFKGVCPARRTVKRVIDVKAEGSTRIEV